MAVEHKQYQTFVIHFHLKSIMTPDGMTMLSNFINLKQKGDLA